ncbi:hypothetical protein ACOSQ4_027116 [Xanthoceras sorbifolium]
MARNMSEDPWLKYETIHRLKHSKLPLNMAFRYIFIAHNLCPSNYRAYVALERASLLYNLKYGRTINMRKYIHNMMRIEEHLIMPDGLLIDMRLQIKSIETIAQSL